VRVTLNLTDKAAELLFRLQPGGRSRTVSTMIERELGQAECAQVVHQAGRSVGVGVRPTSTAEVRKLIEEWP